MVWEAERQFTFVFASGKKSKNGTIPGDSEDPISMLLCPITAVDVSQVPGPETNFKTAEAVKTK